MSFSSIDTDPSRGTRRRHRVSDAAEWAGVLGVAGAVAAFTEFDWITGGSGGALDVDEVRRLAAETPAAAGFARVWLAAGGIGPVLALGLVVLLSLIARYVRVGSRGPWRVLAVGTGLAVAGANVAATLAVVALAGPAATVGPGLYVTVAGYLLLAGAVAVPETRADRLPVEES